MNKKKRHNNLLVGALGAWVLIVAILSFMGYIVIHNVGILLGVLK